MCGQLLKDEISKRWDLGKLGFSPGAPIGTGGSSISLGEDISQWIHSGKVHVTIDEVCEFTGKAVRTKHKGNVIDADIVIFATGFDCDLSFMKCSKLIPASIDRRWWHLTYPINQLHPTLTLLGVFAGNGTAVPILEMQARLAAGIISGLLSLPDLSVMQKEEQNFREEQIKLFFSFPGMVNGAQFTIAISKFVECYPDFTEIAKIDDEFAKMLCEMPLLPGQYRFLCPRSNYAKAKLNILKAMDGSYYNTSIEWNIEPFDGRKLIDNNYIESNVQK